MYYILKYTSKRCYLSSTLQGTSDFIYFFYVLKIFVLERRTSDIAKLRFLTAELLKIQAF
jgi:hypothetical protein